MLNEGKKIMFKKDLIRTINYLKNNKIIPLSIEKKYEILNNVKNSLINTIDSCESLCGICLLPLNNELYGGNCGHCFHKNCLDLWYKQECPTCRMPSNFVKLYI